MCISVGIIVFYENSMLDAYSYSSLETIYILADGY